MNQVRVEVGCFCVYGLHVCFEWRGAVMGAWVVFMCDVFCGGYTGYGWWVT